MPSFYCPDDVGKISECVEMICGNGIREGTEDCDDGSDDGIGCKLGCFSGSAVGFKCGSNRNHSPNTHCFTTCGNGVIEGEENCDD